MLQGLFALLVAATGWYYLFQARGPAQVEDAKAQLCQNRRFWLRRLGGLIMLALGGLIFAGFFAFDQAHPTQAYFLIWLAVCFLVLAVIVLALIDMRLTWKMRQIQRHWNA